VRVESDQGLKRIHGTVRKWEWVRSVVCGRLFLARAGHQAHR
jgi:hypothetical protein